MPETETVYTLLYGPSSRIDNGFREERQASEQGQAKSNRLLASDARK